MHDTITLQQEDWTLTRHAQCTQHSGQIYQYHAYNAGQHKKTSNNKHHHITAKSKE